MQKAPSSAPLHPVDEGTVAALHPELDSARQVSGPPYQRNDLFWRSLYHLEVRSDDFQRPQKIAILFLVVLQQGFLSLKCRPPLLAGEQREETQRRIAHSGQPDVEFSAAELLPRSDHRHIASELRKLVGAHRDAEILSRYIFNFVCLIEDHRGVLGKNASEIVLFHR